MAYNIPRSDPAVSDIVVNDATTNTTATSIELLGRNAPNYGAIVAETQVHLLENFASPNSPANPIPGQLWYNKTAQILFVNTGLSDGDSLAWTPVGTGGGATDFTDLTDTPANYSGAAGQVVAVNGTGTGLEFTTITGVGETNTASNIGGGTGEIFAQKTGVDLEFKTIVAGTGVTITNNASTVQIDATGAGGGETNTGTSLGTGSDVFAQKNGVALEFRSLTAGTNITLTQSATEIEISAAGGPGGLNNVVEDTTPQLGGVLETNGNWIAWESENNAAREDITARFFDFGGPLFAFQPAAPTAGGTNSSVNYVFTMVNSTTNSQDRSVTFQTDGNIRLTSPTTPSNDYDVATKKYVDDNLGTSTYSSTVALSSAGIPSGGSGAISPALSSFDAFHVECFFPSAQLGSAYQTMTFDRSTFRTGAAYAMGPAYQADNTGAVNFTINAALNQVTVTGAQSGAVLTRIIGINY